MAWTTRTTQVAGYVVTNSDWNESVNNDLASPNELVTTDGDIAVATAANTMKRLAAFTGDLLLHEIGGLESDVSGVVLDDGLYGTGTGTIGLRNQISQGDAEAGIATISEPFSALRVAQAISALSAEGAAKAHCFIASAGTLSSPDFGIASVGDTGTGDRDINFTTAFASSVYSALATIGAAADEHDPTFNTPQTGDIQLNIKVASVLTDAATSQAFHGSQ